MNGAIETRSELDSGGVRVLDHLCGLFNRGRLFVFRLPLRFSFSAALLVTSALCRTRPKLFFLPYVAPFFFLFPFLFFFSSLFSLSIFFVSYLSAVSTEFQALTYPLDPPPILVRMFVPQSLFAIHLFTFSPTSPYFGSTPRCFVGIALEWRHAQKTRRRS